MYTYTLNAQQKTTEYKITIVTIIYIGTKE